MSPTLVCDLVQSITSVFLKVANLNEPKVFYKEAARKPHTLEVN